MRYFISILVLTVVTVVAILGFRGSHSRKTSLYIFPDMEWQLKLRPHPNRLLTGNCVFALHDSV